jgi:hypothetical protein
MCRARVRWADEHISGCVTARKRCTVPSMRIGSASASTSTSARTTRKRSRRAPRAGDYAGCGRVHVLARREQHDERSTRMSYQRVRRTADHSPRANAASRFLMPAGASAWVLRAQMGARPWTKERAIERPRSATLLLSVLDLSRARELTDDASTSGAGRARVIRRAGRQLWRRPRMTAQRCNAHRAQEAAAAADLWAAQRHCYGPIIFSILYGLCLASQ